MVFSGQIVLMQTHNWNFDHKNTLEVDLITLKIVFAPLPLG